MSAATNKVVFWVVKVTKAPKYAYADYMIPEYPDRYL